MIRDKDIDVCIIIDDDFIKNKYIIENILINTSPYLYNLHIYAKNDVSEEQDEYLSTLINIKEINVFIKYFDNYKLSEIYNTFLTESKCLYLSICLSNIIIPNHSFELLKYFHKTTLDSGICSLKSNYFKKELTSFLTYDEFGAEEKFKWLYQDSDIHITDNSVILFNRELIEKIGYFDNDLSDEFILQDYLYRSMSVNLKNYYIPNKIAIKYKTFDNNDEIEKVKYTQEELKAFTDNLNNMLKTNNFKKVWN